MRVLLAVTTLVLGFAFAQMYPEYGAEQQALYEQAQLEGEVVLYTSFGQEAADAMLAAFTEEYPGIKAVAFRAGSGAVLERFLSEVEAGVDSADVVLVAVPDAWPDIKAQGLLMEYNSPAYAEFADQYKDPGFTIIGRVLVNSVAYNTELVSPELAETLTTLEDWVVLAEQPEYRGRFGIMDPVRVGASFEGIYQWRAALGEDTWRGLYGRLGRADIRLSSGGGDSTAKLTTGEWAFTFDATSYRIAAAADSGAPVAFQPLEEGVNVLPTPMSISANAPHPSAAKLLFNWWNSAAGQSHMVQVADSYSAHPHATAPEGFPALAELNSLALAIGEWSELANARDTVMSELMELGVTE